jgi:DNA-binding transcriptional ArsR family regulator
MSRPQTESIREFILDCVADGPRSVARQVAQAYGISRQAANRHLDALVDSGVLEQAGATRSKEYRLLRTSLLNREIRVTPVLNADRFWDDHMAPVLVHDRPAVRELCRGAFGEVIRNVIRHAQATWITVSFEMTARNIEVRVADDGNGIFGRLAERVGVSAPRDAATLMLRHASDRSSDFPAARLLLLAQNFEWFEIASSSVVLTYHAATDSWSISDRELPANGTRVSMKLCRAEKMCGTARAGSMADSFTR